MTEDSKWHKVCAMNDLTEGRKIGKLIRGNPVFVVQVEGEVYCYEYRCPHAGAPLADGKQSQSLLTCRHHQWQFDLRTGKSIRPAGKQLQSYDVKIGEGDILVSL